MSLENMVGFFTVTFWNAKNQKMYLDFKNFENLILIPNQQKVLLKYMYYVFVCGYFTSKFCSAFRRKATLYSTT